MPFGVQGGLSGGVHLYVGRRRGYSVMRLGDAVKLKPETVQLWTGDTWAPVHDWGQCARSENEIELRLRSGEQIGCGPKQLFSTTDGIIEARDLIAGHQLLSACLPEPAEPLDSSEIGIAAARLSGLFLAEGNRDESTIEISANISERERLNWTFDVAKHYGGSGGFKRNSPGKKLYIRLYGSVVNSVVSHLVFGEGARHKCLQSSCWSYSNAFLRALLEEYLLGDGAWDGSKNRWRLGFTRNYALARDLRVLVARLGGRLVINRSHVTFQGKRFKTFKGEFRFEVSGYRTCKSPFEVVEIGKSRCRYIHRLKLKGCDRVVLSSGVVVPL